MPDLNNPAERLEQALVEAKQASTDTASVRDVFCSTWGLDPTSLAGRAEFLRRSSELLKIAIDVRSRAATIEPMGPRALEHFDQVETVLANLSGSGGRKSSVLWTGMSETGWYSLSLLSTLLVQPPRRDVSEESIAQLVEQTQRLLADLVAADEIDAKERQRLVGLLMQVQDALLRAQITGAGPVENAIDGVLGGLVRLYVAGSALASHPVATGAVALVNAVALTFGLSADYLALEGPLGGALGLQLPPG